MTLKRISNIVELAQFLPELVRLHSDLDGKWEDELDQDTFFLKLLSNFREDSYYFGELNDDGHLKYFIATLPQDREKALFWLFYMNPDHREETRALLGDLRGELKRLGFKEVRFSTTRLTKSYQRWVEKFGAEPYELIYKLHL